MKIRIGLPWVNEPLCISWIFGAEYYEDPCECDGESYSHMFKGIAIHLVLFSIVIEREIFNGEPSG